MWLSTKHSSVEMERYSAKVNVLLPRMAKMADRSRENEMVQHIQDNIWLYSKQVGKVTIETVDFLTKTTKVKEADSTLQTWSNTVYTSIRQSFFYQTSYNPYLPNFFTAKAFTIWYYDRYCGVYCTGNEITIFKISRDLSDFKMRCQFVFILDLNFCAFLLAINC